ncbi:family 20 glycosylhydrolase [Chitinophaga sp. Ak27]|uniref:family 20 glycosylhydrolase n=1 Tax=Chitinophaga sp. Ak27 TaxID=2726116 RepID=UPI00145FB43A|nr:family 20 glycosylhydrolase [Chitinophaga sp. Ak27]NLU90477.1 family 20 glycosylhydrolase [Chitinophaga sp. Ak27]
MVNRKKNKFTLLLICLVLVCDIARSQVNNSLLSWKAEHTLEELSHAPVALIPFPRELQWTKDKWQLSDSLVIAVEDQDQSITGNALRSLHELLRGLSIQSSLKTVRQGERLPSNCIVFKVDSVQCTKNEGYSLRISKGGIVVGAKDVAGFYYAVQTLRQIVLQTTLRKQIPGCIINDWPAFGLRGFMHDNGRNFQSVTMLKTQLDKLSWYKFNTFHWHFTDNPAWRPESKIYPQLNDPKNRRDGRDPDSSYSFDDIRELIRYAKERCITIIPELDMPGHSEYFEPTFGFKMESEHGMQVLERLIDEFCKEIPVADCPIIHLGSDEVHIPNPSAFIQRMSARVKENNRKVMVWNPGLPPLEGTIEQLWREDGATGERTSGNPYIDSYGGYLNNYDAFSLVRRYFFQQVCNRPIGDSVALGGIVCCWPDVKVDDKSKIILYNAVWPGIITYSEAVWCGRPFFEPLFVNALPAKGTVAYKYFREFEGRLARHRDNFFFGDYFPYAQFGNSEWILRGPYYHQKGDSTDRRCISELSTIDDTTYKVKVTGGIQQVNVGENAAMFNDKVLETAYLTGYIYTPAAKEVHAFLGFEAPARSNRRSGGIPLNKQWDANGGAVFINRQELRGPEWANPGGNRYLHNTWGRPANEIPFTDEEFYWSRPPAKIQLRKGWNEIFVKIPRAYREQRWLFAFVPVIKDVHGKWVEDLSVHISATKD